MINVPPSIRISIGMTFISITVLMCGSFVGLIPDESRIAIAERKSTAESLTVRCMYAIQNKDIASFKKIMDTIAESEPDILSLGLRTTEGRYIIQTKGHYIRWDPTSAGVSSFDNWQVPIYQGSQQWGILEISFSPQKGVTVLGYRISPYIQLIIFIAVLSFISFVIFLKRTLRHLDPSSVMPTRVKNAFDTLSEAVILIDTKPSILLANSVFMEKTEHTNKNLLGIDISKLDWLDPKTNMPCKEFPWTKTLLKGEKQYGYMLNFNTKSNGMLNFVVNCSPILNDKGKSLGAVASFIDITESEKKSFQLSRMVELLKLSREKIKDKNKELEVLATRDPLTGTLNRRAFYEKAENLLEELTSQGKNLACIMVDLDWFKSVNDTYGHLAGDEVLKYCANTLESVSRETDLVCRYGGEEFCVLLPNCGIDDASVIAGRIRLLIAVPGGHTFSFGSDIKLSASFGVSDITQGATRISHLMEQADSALYTAKRAGRNQVISFRGENEVSFEKIAENQ